MELNQLVTIAGLVIVLVIVIVFGIWLGGGALT